MNITSLNDLYAQLDSDPDRGLPGIRFHGADMREADLRGRHIACLSLRAAILDGADLRGVSLSHVDLSGASLDGTQLADARLQMVSVRGVSLCRTVAPRTYWDVVDLTGANLADSDFRNAVFRTCVMERARFDGASLTEGRLDKCTCTDASFRYVNWKGATTCGSRFRDADLEGARDFFQCRELVTKILAPLIDEGFDVAQLVGAVALDESRCYPEWSAFLAANSRYRALSAALFARYPDSGIAEALQTAKLGHSHSPSM